MKYLVLFLFFTMELTAQQTRWDTTKYRKYHAAVIVGVYQSYRNFNNSFSQSGVSDSSGISNTELYAESNKITGIDLTYDKFGVSVGFRTTPQDESSGKGYTKDLGLTVTFGGNTLFNENTFRYFKGFYDSNTAQFDSSFQVTGKYYQQGNLTNTLVRSRVMYFTNHRRFAFRSGYVGNYRQLRSAASWVFSGSVSYFDMQNDSSFFAPPVRPYYGDYGTLNGFTAYGLSAQAGGAFNLVIMKGFFVSMFFVGGPEQQWRTYHFNGSSSLVSHISASGSFRASIGVNLRRCYFISSTVNDFSVYKTSDWELNSRSLSGSVSFGWRFPVKTHKLY